MNALFELDGVWVSRGGTPVLSGLTDKIPKGANAVLGPSGSGKSTLLRLLNRLADPERGRSRYRGADVRERDVLALRRQVGFVPQLPAPLEGPWRKTALRGRGWPAARPTYRPRAGARRLTASFAEREAKQLSADEQQRVMLARPLALEPDVLLLDEPTSALDPEGARRRERSCSSCAERLALLRLVTHDHDQGRRLADEY